MKFHWRYLATVPLIAAALHAAPVRSEDAPAAAVQQAPAQQMPAQKIPDVCEITGTVAAMQEVTRSPWSDGTPSMLSAQEMDVAVVIAARMPHDKAVDAATCRNDAVQGKRVTYKLCSPTQIKAGDTIHGTEGLATMDAYGIGCLFDVAILPKS